MTKDTIPNRKKTRKDKKLKNITNLKKLIGPLVAFSLIPIFRRFSIILVNTHKNIK